MNDGLADWEEEHVAPLRDPMTDVAARRGYALACLASMRISQMFARGSRKLVILKNIFSNKLPACPFVAKA